MTQFKTEVIGTESTQHHTPEFDTFFCFVAFLGKQLEDYLQEHYGNKVRVVRATKREGLIRARLLAAKQATGDVIVVLDSHIEANTNWLPPLIGRLFVIVALNHSDEYLITQMPLL